MGKGNINLSLPLRGGFFINNDNFISYADESKEMILEYVTESNYYDFIDQFQQRFTNKHSEFKSVDDVEIILISHLFNIIVEDNEWSVAIRFNPTNDVIMLGQELFYNVYLESMKNILLDMFDSIHTYAGAWTSGLIRKEVKE